MSERRDAIVKALKKIGIAEPNQDEIDTAANQLDYIVPVGQPDASDAEADLAVSRGEECKQRLTQKRAAKAAEKAAKDLEKERGRAP